MNRAPTVRVLGPTLGIALAFGIALALGPCVRAQSAALHQIPVRGALLYDREYKREVKILAPDPETLTNKNVHEVPHAGSQGVVLHSDLDEKGKHLRLLPAAIPEIWTYLALDFTTIKKKKLDVTLPQIRPFAPWRLRGEISPIGEDGVQRLVVAFHVAPQGKKDAKPTAELAAELTIVRQFDADHGMLKRIESVLKGEIAFPDRKEPTQVQRASFTLRETFKLREVVANRGVKFDARVAAAIRKGAELIKKSLGDVDKKVPAAPEPSGHTRQSGELALRLLTLLKAGESPDDPVIKKALDSLRGRKLFDTYSLSVALLAFEACYTPAREREDLLSGRIDAPRVRKPSESDRRVMQQWVEQLLFNRTEGGRDSQSRWHYLKAASFDNSNTQYAILGLYAAHLCGIEVDRKVWAGAARHFLQMQSMEKDWMRLSLVSHEQLESGTTSRRTAGAIKPGGWSYTGKYGTVTGSMTTAGIGSLAICDAALGRKRRPRGLSSNVLVGAMRAGLGWLANHYDLRHNPGAGFSWRLYYLYGIERACELSQVAYLQGNDWYFDGATLLLEEQGANGSWGPDTDTCFGILFLKKAALPVVTGKR